MILNFIRTHIRSIVILLFFVITSVIIIYLLPHEGKFMFEYQKGGFWKHESLTAPFNFPVNKTKAEIDHERDSVMHEFRPIFVFDSKIGPQRIQEMEEDFNARWIEYSMALFKIPSRNEYKTNRKYSINRQLEADYRNYVSSLLQEIYRKGIIDMSPLEENGKPNYTESKCSERKCS